MRVEEDSDTDLIEEDTMSFAHINNSPYHNQEHDLNIQPQLLRYTNRPSDNHSILDNWDYDIFTKERYIPKAMMIAGRAIENINEAFIHLDKFNLIIGSVTKSLKPAFLIETEKMVKQCLRTQNTLFLSLESNVNALRLYWFPETVEQFFEGAYKSIRQPIVQMSISSEDLPLLMCSICQDPISTAVTSEGCVIFRRRCHLNPLLNLKCEGRHCECTRPCLCLKCALDYFLKNCIFEGRSCVGCVTCRAEVCIYDIQEVNLKIQDESAEEEKLKKLRISIKEMEKQRDEILAELDEAKAKK